MEMPPDEIGRMERAAKYWRGLYHLQSVTNVKIEFGKSGAGETGEICRFLAGRRGGPVANKMTTIQSKYSVTQILHFNPQMDKVCYVTASSF